MKKYYTLKEISEKTGKSPKEILDDYVARQVYKLIFAGFLIAVAIHSLLQDIVGKEAYLNMAQNHWISASITVPIAIVYLLWAAGWIAKARQNIDRIASKVDVENN